MSYTYLCMTEVVSRLFETLSAVESLERSVSALRTKVTVRWLICLCSLLTSGVK